MITRATIEAALRAWLTASMSGVAVIFADQGAPVPTAPFATIKLGTLVPVGHDHRLGYTDPGAPAYMTQSMCGDRKLTVSVNVFGSGAMDYARAGANALSKETVRDPLNVAGLAPAAGVPEVRELTGLLDTGFEERAQFDAMFFLGETYTDTMPVIERVSGEGTLEYPEDVARGTVDFDTGA